MPVQLGYLTIPVLDTPRAMAFFGAVFGWTFDPSSGPAGAHVDNVHPPIGLSRGGPTDYSNLYFQVPDIAGALGRLVALGGAAGEISESPSGISAVCGDDQGTRFSLWQPAPGFEG